MVKFLQVDLISLLLGLWDYCSLTKRMPVRASLNEIRYFFFRENNLRTGLRYNYIKKRGWFIASLCVSVSKII